MLVDLRTLKPNPFRNYVVDPIDPDHVTQLTESITQDGFWGGVVCRRTAEGIHIVAGHHRVAAALRAGIESADLVVKEFDDASVIRIYARENATQRGDSGAAV